MKKEDQAQGIKRTEMTMRQMSLKGTERWKGEREISKELIDDVWKIELI